METYNINLTQEECAELATTIMGRIQFDIPGMQDEAAAEKDYKRVAYLQHIAEIHKGILEKIPAKAMRRAL